MIGENEHEFERESAGDPTPPDPSMPEADAAPGDSGALDRADDYPRKRRFGAWGAARREEPAPSLWHRASQKIKQLFARPKTDEPEEVLDEAASTPDDLPYLVAPDEPVEVTEQPAWDAGESAHATASAADAHSIPVVPPTAEAEPPSDQRENLKFLWSAKEGPSAEPVNASAPDEFDAPPEHMDSAGSADIEQPVAETPREKRPSFFKRLFGRKRSDADAEEIPDTNESEIPVEASHDAIADLEVGTPVHEKPAYSDLGAPQADVPELDADQADQESAPIEPALDEALPMDEAHVEAPSDEPVVEAAADDFGSPFGAEPEPEPPRKSGFFARLFGRKPAEPPPMEFVAEPDSERDAAGELDAVDQGFEAARSDFAPPEHAPDRSFSSVEDALPLDATMDIQPAVTASSFAPPPAADAPPSAAAGDEHMFFGGNTFDFEPPKDDRSTVEVTPVSDDRKTAEVSAQPDIAAHADEEGRKTDEFEMIELDGATLQEPAVSPLEGKTAEVPKVSLLKKLFSRTKEVTQVEPAVAPPPSANPTFLVQKFRTFYNEVVVYKNQKTEFTAGFATAIVTDYTADLSPEQAAQSLAVRLQQMLELQLAESSWMGGEIQELYPDAQYAMACLADEMLTNLEWPGQSAWGKHRLELTVFKTVASELEVFKRIDKLLKNGPRTVGTRDLARVYLLVIASGFLGKYRPFRLPRALAEYRRRLYEFVYDGDALMLYAGERRIFPEATSSTVAGRGVKRFSLAQQWAAILVLLLISYTVISHMAWKRVSADLKDIAARVEQARTATPTDSPNGGGGR